MNTIQQQYEELAAKLHEVAVKRKKVEAVREERTRPLREQLKVELTSLLEEYNNILVIETELRNQIKELYGQAKAAREQAYAQALAAQAAGDLEEVAAASIRAAELSLTPTSNVFFRTTMQLDVADFEQIPREYLTVDWKKVEQASSGIPGISATELPIVVVKHD